MALRTALALTLLALPGIVVHADLLFDIFRILLDTVRRSSGGILGILQAALLGTVFSGTLLPGILDDPGSFLAALLDKLEADLENNSLDDAAPTTNQTA